MSDTFTATLRNWQGFYQVTGESAATLTGLMFIAITLGARIVTAETLPLMRTLISPVLGYFLMALVLSALMCIPSQTRFWLTGALVGSAFVAPRPCCS